MSNFQVNFYRDIDGSKPVGFYYTVGCKDEG